MLVGSVKKHGAYQAVAVLAGLMRVPPVGTDVLHGKVVREGCAGCDAALRDACCTILYAQRSAESETSVNLPHSPLPILERVNQLTM